ncbi:MAG: arsenic resistance protein [Cytophagaceae bacterium]
MNTKQPAAVIKNSSSFTICLCFIKFPILQNEYQVIDLTAMNSINKYQSLIIALAIVIGILIGQLESGKVYAQYLIVPFLMMMLFGVFLNIPSRNLLKGFYNLKFLFSNTIVNFLWTPVFAYFLGYIFLKNELNLWIGFLMLMVTPCTDWYLIFTGIAKGNTSLSASILPLNLFLQIILLPIYLFVFFGRTGYVDTAVLYESVLLVLVIPFVLAQLFKYVSGKIKFGKYIENKVLPFFDVGQVIFLGLAIMAMFASQGDYLTKNIEIFLILLVPVLLFFVINFFLGQIISRFMKFNYEDTASLNLTTLARNSPISLAIAITAFPDEPLVALALVIGPLIELPILAIVSQILLRIRKYELKKG